MNKVLTSHHNPAFDRVAEKISKGAAKLGLEVPVFDSHPNTPGHTRTLRRSKTSNGQTVFIVAVAVKERLTSAVVADMIEGVCVVNRLDEKRAGEVRSSLWKAATSLSQTADAGSAPAQIRSNNYMPIRIAA